MKACERCTSYESVRAYPGKFGIVHLCWRCFKSAQKRGGNQVRIFLGQVALMLLIIACTPQFPVCTTTTTTALLEEPGGKVVIVLAPGVKLDVADSERRPGWLHAGIIIDNTRYWGWVEANECK